MEFSHKSIICIFRFFSDSIFINIEILTEAERKTLVSTENKKKMNINVFTYFRIHRY